jgi:hypothetical protein
LQQFTYIEAIWESNDKARYVDFSDTNGDVDEVADDVCLKSTPQIAVPSCNRFSFKVYNIQRARSTEVLDAASAADEELAILAGERGYGLRDEVDWELSNWSKHFQFCRGC